MAKKYQINNVKPFRNLIEQRGFTTAQFIREVSDLTGKNTNTVSNYVYGTSNPDDDAVTAFAMVLNVTENKIRSLITHNKMYMRTNKHTNENKTKKTSTRGHGDHVWVDKNGFKQNIGKYSNKVIENELGLYPSIISKWLCHDRTAPLKDLKRVAILLGCNVNALIEKENGAEIVVDTQEEVVANIDNENVIVHKIITPNKPVTKIKKPIASTKNNVKNIAITEITDETDIYAIANILNNNIKSVAERLTEISNPVKELQNIIAVMKSLSDKISDIEKKMDKIEGTSVIIDSKGVMSKKKASADNDNKKLKIEVTKENIKYDIHDDCKHFLAKTDAMIKKIAKDRGQSFNDVNNEYYTKMNRIYGVVWDQLRKEYYAKYGVGARRTAELLWANPNFGQVYFNLLYNACFS